MSDWTAGYIAEINYTHGYYRELSPTLLSLTTLVRSLETRARRPLRYLELGFGQGLSLNVHAAACPGEYWGTDFNPAQVANALDLAEASGNGAQIFDQSFAEFAARSDLPQFDIIALHGIWSWISDENRRVIVDLARRKLAVGGIFYISYNCTPGWAPGIPLRHLMSLHADLAGAEDKGIVNRIEAALDFAQQVVDSGAQYFKANPLIADRLQTLRKANRNYLAHEFFNRDWLPMAFSDVAALLAQAKLEFGASAHLLDYIDGINLSPDGHKLLSQISHSVLRESVRDYLTNKQFRKDIFIRGARTLPAVTQLERLRNSVFVLTTPADKVPMKVRGSLCEASLKEDFYRLLLDIFSSQQYAPKSFNQIVAHPSMKNSKLSDIYTALLLLTGSGHLHPVQTNDSQKQARPRCKALNSHLIQKSCLSADVGVLASPVTGGGVEVGQFEQLFLLARSSGRKQPVDWARFVWDILRSQNKYLMKDGQTLTEDEDNLSILSEQAQEFALRRLPILQAVEVA